jgi:hypothetical protein
MGTMTYFVALALRRLRMSAASLLLAIREKRGARSKRSERLPHWRLWRTLRSRRVLADRGPGFGRLRGC